MKPMRVAAADESTESIWRERVREWRDSGEPAEDFAKGRGFAPTTLRWWSSRLNRTNGSGFVQLVARPTTVAASTELIVEVAGARVRVCRGFDAALLVDVVSALAGGSR